MCLLWVWYSLSLFTDSTDRLIALAGRTPASRTLVCRIVPATIFAVKRTPPGKDGSSSPSSTNPLPDIDESETPSVIVVGGIDWRFADPEADMIAGLKCSKLATSQVARSLITRLGGDSSLVDGLSRVQQIAFYVRDSRTVLMAGGSAWNAAHALPPGWKAVPVLGNAILIGDSDAVVQAIQRIEKQGPLQELPGLARQKQAAGDFFAIETARVFGAEAAAAGVKRFSLAASIRDRLTVDAAYEFNDVPDLRTLPVWPATFSGETAINGNVVHLTMSIDADSGEIAASPIGQAFGPLVKTARYVPVPETTIRTKPVIYGLDEGPRELKK